MHHGQRAIEEVLSELSVFGLWKKIFLINFYWIYTVIIVPIVQPHKYIYLCIFGFSSFLGHHSALCRVPRAVQYVLISYLF